MYSGSINGVSEIIYGSEFVTGGGGGGTGQDGLPGKSAYQLAVQNGFVGSLTEWLDSLRGEDGEDALVFGSELIPLLPGTPGEKGEDSKDGRDVDPYGSEIIGLLPGPEGKEGKSGKDGEDAILFASEIIGLPSGASDEKSEDSDGSDQYGSEIIGLLPGPEGKPGKDGEDAILFASEFIPCMTAIPDDTEKNSDDSASDFGSEILPTGIPYFPETPQYSAQIFVHMLTATDIVNKYFDIPLDLPEVARTRRNKAALAVETDIQAIGVDYKIIDDDAGKLRRVSWNGLGLDTDMPVQEGWPVSLWYYARLWHASGIGEPGPEGKPGKDGEDAILFASEIIGLPPGASDEKDKDGDESDPYGSEIIGLLPGPEGKPGKDGEDAVVFASEVIGLLPGSEGKKGDAGKDGEDADPYGSEIIGLLPGPEGKEGKSGEDAVVFASEIIGLLPGTQSGGGIDDAPDDGRFYIRGFKQWLPLNPAQLMLSGLNSLLFQTADVLVTGLDSSSIEEAIIMNIIKALIRPTKDITANWQLNNPVLPDGVMALEELADGSIKMKIGDGVTPWNTLPYFFNGSVLGASETDPVYTADKPSIAFKSEIPQDLEDLTNNGTDPYVKESDLEPIRDLIISGEWVNDTNIPLKTSGMDGSEYVVLNIGNEVRKTGIAGLGSVMTIYGSRITGSIGGSLISSGIVGSYVGYGVRGSCIADVGDVGSASGYGNVAVTSGYGLNRMTNENFGKLIGSFITVPSQSYPESFSDRVVMSKNVTGSEYLYCIPGSSLGSIIASGISGISGSNIGEISDVGTSTSYANVCITSGRGLNRATMSNFGSLITQYLKGSQISGLLGSNLTFANNSTSPPGYVLVSSGGQNGMYSLDWATFKAAVKS